jgi:hypothetical protein
MNGEYTNSLPEKGLITIRVGMVIRVGNDTGAILVFSRFQPFLGMLSDVSISDVNTGQILIYDNDLEIWVNSDLEAEKVIYDTTYGGMQANLQSAVSQLFYMFKFMTLELDGASSGVFYNSDLDINGGLSNSIFGNSFNSGSSQVVQLNSVNGGVSADYSINLLNAGFSDTVYTDELNFGDSSVSSEDTINGGES